MTSTCNDERASFGVMSGHVGMNHRLSRFEHPLEKVDRRLGGGEQAQGGKGVGNVGCKRHLALILGGGLPAARPEGIDHQRPSASPAPSRAVPTQAATGARSG